MLPPLYDSDGSFAGSGGDQLMPTLREKAMLLPWRGKPKNQFEASGKKKKKNEETKFFLASPQGCRLPSGWMNFHANKQPPQYSKWLPKYLHFWYASSSWNRSLQSMVGRNNMRPGREQESVEFQPSCPARLKEKNPTKRTVLQKLHKLRCIVSSIETCFDLAWREERARKKNTSLSPWECTEHSTHQTIVNLETV